jgi:hypothetical protein
VDEPGPEAETFAACLHEAGHLRARIPSRKGYHLITWAFDMRTVSVPNGVSLHKDNPTNLYIPDGAE